MHRLALPTVAGGLLVVLGLAAVAIATLLYPGTLPAEPTSAQGESVARLVLAPPGIRIFQFDYYDAVIADPADRRPQQPYQVETLAGWTTIDSCADVVAVLAAPPEREFVAPGVDRLGFHFERCEAAALVRRTRPALRSHFSRESPLRDVVQRLNLLQVGSILNPAHPERDDLRWFEIGRTEAFTNAQFRFEPTEISVEAGDWWFGMELVASGDWSGDGLEDVLVMFADDARAGSWSTYRPIMLEAPSAEGTLRVREGFELLRELLRAEQPR